MKKLILFTAVLVAGCDFQTPKNQSHDITNDTSLVAANNTAVPLITPGCYSYITKNDSAFLKLEISGNKISGDLHYSLYEKDNNKGTINGTLKDSLIIAYYTFQSEGMTSVRQVVFEINDSSLIEGFGDIEVRGDTAKFKNISQLQFQDQRPFIRSNCK